MRQTSFFMRSKLFTVLLLCVAGVHGTVLAQAESPFGLRLAVTDVADVHVDLRVTLEIPDRHLVYAGTLTVTDGQGQGLTPVRLPEAAEKEDPADPGKKVRFYGKTGDSLWRWDTMAERAVVRVSFQGCDDAVCFMPEEHRFEFDRAAKTLRPITDTGTGEADGAGAGWAGGYSFRTGGGYMGAAAFLAFLDQDKGGAENDQSGALAGFLRDPVAFFRARGLFVTLLLVLAGGVLLNLTPCVLPMMPINLGLIGAGAGTRGRGFLLGASYGGGIVLVYGGLGWLILRSGIFFGALQASPWFSLAVALIFTALALALFDVLLIDLTKFMTQRESGRKGAAAAFSAGALSALLAGACVAPVVLAVLLLAGTLYAGGVREAQFLPFVLGLGMALPWPFAGAGLSVMPRPGQWMVRVKQAFGVLLAALAAYYFYLAAVGFMPAGRVAREGSITAGDRAAWDQKLARARREGKPLFVDFWATWCKNCSVMERTTFESDRVKARLAGYVVVKVQAEKPGESPAREMLNDFGIRGLPGFVVIRPE